MTEIKDSVIATGGSKISNIKINRSINQIKRKSFIWGFTSGILSSLIASVIWYFVAQLF